MGKRGLTAAQVVVRHAAAGGGGRPKGQTGGLGQGARRSLGLRTLTDLDVGQWMSGVIHEDGYLHAWGAEYVEVEAAYQTTIGVRTDGGIDCWGRYCPQGRCAGRREPVFLPI